MPCDFSPFGSGNKGFTNFMSFNEWQKGSSDGGGNNGNNVNGGCLIIFILVILLFMFIKANS